MGAATGWTALRLMPPKPQKCPRRSWAADPRQGNDGAVRSREAERDWHEESSGPAPALRVLEETGKAVFVEPAVTEDNLELKSGG